MPDGDRPIPRRRRRVREDPRQCWGTPRVLGLNLCEEYGLTIDLAANERNALLPYFISPEENSLSIPWGPCWRGFLNPPYENIPPWSEKAEREAGELASTTGMLLPLRLEQRWCCGLSVRSEWWGFDGRIPFIPAPGVKASSNREASMWSVVGPDVVPGFHGIRCHKTGVILERLEPGRFDPAEVLPALAGVCRVCGCTDDDCSGCVARTGGPCSWVELDLCSACAELLERELYMPEVYFEVTGRPRSKGRPRATLQLPRDVEARLRKVGLTRDQLAKYIHIHTDRDTEKAEARIRGNARPFVRTPLEGALRLDVGFVFQTPKRGRQHGEPHTARPDVDNLVKAAADALRTVAFADDASIAVLHAEKFYGPVAKTTVAITQIGGIPATKEKP